MQALPIQDKSRVNDFLLSCPGNPFLQSGEWAEFLQATGQPFHYWAVEDKGGLVLVAGLAEKPLGAGKKYLYCPQGPVISQDSAAKQAVSVWQEAVKQEARRLNAVFLRLEPEQAKLWPVRGLVKTIDVQPAQTVVLDLGLPSATLLGQMHPKTRYNIRLAGRKGVTVEEASGAAAVSELWQMMRQTARRDGFRLHHREYYEQMLTALGGGSLANPAKLKLRLYFARYGSELLAAAIVGFFGNFATYLHGASANSRRNLMAPYALQWHAMLAAQQAGYRYYDLYGVDEQKWPGVTRFKRGFGGQVISRAGTYDWPLAPNWYRLYTFIRYMRRKFL